MDDRMIRIGLLSFAHLHAAGYAGHLQKQSGVEIVGLWNEEDGIAEEMAARYDIKRYGSPGALISAGLDGVVICSENVNHRPLVELAAGKVPYILCEKPIATTVADGQAMIDICRQRGSKLQIAFPVRFHPVFVQLKEMLDRGDLGRVLSVECTNHGSLPGGWFVEENLSGGGAVIDHTVHVIDLLRWFWDTEVTEVFAEVGDSLVHPDLGIDDAGMLSFTLDNGVYGTLDTSWSRPSSYTTWGDVKIEVIAEGGVLYADMSKQHVSVSANQVGQTRWHGWGGNMDAGLIADFIETIRQQRAPSISGEDGLRALEVALAAYDSAGSGLPKSITRVGSPGVKSNYPAETQRKHRDMSQRAS